MKIKLFLGSIGVIAILILVSFPSAVSVQSTPSIYVTDSPLFNIRINRATNNENNRILTSNYLGKGLHIMQFPLRDTNTIMIQKFLNRIRILDDSTFNTFITLVLRLIHKEPKFHNVNTQKLCNVLYQLKNNQDILSNKDIDFDNNVNRTDFTLGFIVPVNGCDLKFLIYFLIIMSLGLFLFFAKLVITIFSPERCMTPSFNPTC